MIRKLMIPLVALAALLALPPAASFAAPLGSAPIAAPIAAPITAPIAAPIATSSVQRAACQQTFHARPASTGVYSDPCAFFSTVKLYYSYAVDVKFRWECISLGNGCHITAGWTVLRICRSQSPPGSTDSDAISVDANSLNFFQTKVAFQVFSPGPGPKTASCDDLTGPIVGMKGCGSNDGHLIGAYPGIVSIMGRGRGTIFGHNPNPTLPDFLRIPTEQEVAGSLFNSSESYYWIGRGGVCS